MVRSNVESIFQFQGWCRKYFFRVFFILRSNKAPRLTGSCGSPFPFTWTSALLLLSSSHGSNVLKKPVNCPGKAPLSRFACVCLRGGRQLSLFPQSHKLEVTLRAQSASGSLSCPEYFILGAGCFVWTLSGALWPDCPQSVISILTW